MDKDKISECVVVLEEDVRRTATAMTNQYKPEYFNAKRLQAQYLAIRVLERVDVEKILDIIMNHEVIKSLHTLKKANISNKSQREVLRTDFKTVAQAIITALTAEKEG
jgi:predicted transcriptional regulator